MTSERMIELLKAEHDCVLRNRNGECDRNCGDCYLVQDDSELLQMYTETIRAVKECESKSKVIEVLKLDLKSTLAVVSSQSNVLRCGECKYHQADDSCAFHGDRWKPDGFCSDGVPVLEEGESE